MNYGTVGTTPDGVWSATKQYKVGRIVTYDGSSYLAHTVPPVGTLPTNASYWQVSAQGTSTATSSSLGVSKPDNTTLQIAGDGTMSAKTATQSTPGVVKGSAGIKVGSGGSIDVDTTFTQATTLANIIAGEAIATVLGKVSKAVATTLNLNSTALLKSMLSGVDVNDANKVPNSAFIHTLVERIGMTETLAIGDNLTDAVNKVSSDLDELNINAPTRMATGSIVSGSNYNQLRLQVEGQKLVIYDNTTGTSVGYILLSK